MRRDTIQYFGSKIASSLAGAIHKSESVLSPKRSPQRLPQRSNKSKFKQRKRSNRSCSISISSIEISDSSAHYPSEYDDSDLSTEASKRHQKSKQIHKSKTRRRYSSSSYTSSENSDSFEYLTHDELSKLRTKELKRKCHDARINTRNCSKKRDYVNLIYSYYHASESEDYIENKSSKVSRRRSTIINNDEVEQMVVVLQELLPFYGEGDITSDTVVRETIEKLPSYALDMRDKAGNTILLLACQYKAQELVHIMIVKGCDVNAQNHIGACSLHYACYTDSLSIETAKVLIDHGAFAEVQENEFGCTPLHWAAFVGFVDLCIILCKAGALPTTIDKNGCDPIHYATQGNRLECLQYLNGIKQSISLNNNNEINEWKRLVDEQSGHIYFHNFETGESMWEDEYNRQNNSDIGEVIRYQSEEETNYEDKIERQKASDPSIASRRIEHVENEKIMSQNKPFTNSFLEGMSEASSTPPKKSKKLGSFHPSRTSKDSKAYTQKNEADAKLLKVTIPSKSEILSPIVFSPEEPMHSKKDCPSTVTKDRFEERLASLQTTMEEKLASQLQNLESKINVHPKVSPKTPTLSLEAQKSLSEMGSKIIQLQTELGTKDMEIISLNRDITSLRTKLIKCGSPKSKSPRRPALRDAMVGEGVVSKDIWVQSSVLKQIRSELKLKSDKLKRVDEECMKAKSTSQTFQRLLSAKEEKIKSLEVELKTSEEVFQAEKFAKEELQELLKQAQEGIEIEIESQMNTYIIHEKERASKLVTNLKDKMKEESNKNMTERVNFLEEIDKYKLEILTNKSEIGSLIERIDDQTKCLSLEKTKISTLETTLSKLKEEHANEENRLFEEYNTKTKTRLQEEENEHKSELESFHNLLNDERAQKLEKELEKNNARQEMLNAMEKKKKAEQELSDMKKMIIDAKKMIRANEQLHKALHVETDRRKTLHNKLEDLKGKIRVYVRVRPLNMNERKRDSIEVLSKEDDRTCVMYSNHDNGVEPKAWEFDQIFCGENDKGNSQQRVFKDTKRLITSAVDGFNVCIFAYGQTGSGKTFTMFGPTSTESHTETNEEIGEKTGLVPRAAAELFRVLQEREANNEVSVNVTMLELYNDKLHDLLSLHNKKDVHLKIKLAQHSQTGMVEVEGAVNEQIESLGHLLALFHKGAKNRATSSTQMNADSSRSHFITCIVTKLTNKRTKKSIYGKLTLVDLAGSEKVSKSGAEGQQLKEAQSINKSLSALGDVISSLTNGSKHIPYRNHPLTMLMSDSIGGNAKTLMFVCCSPADYNRNESINSLDFAQRCKKVVNDTNAKGSHISQVRALKVELARMKKEKGMKTKRKMGVVKRPGM